MNNADHFSTNYVLVTFALIPNWAQRLFPEPGVGVTTVWPSRPPLLLISLILLCSMCTHSTHTGLIIIYREQGKPICKAANDEAEARSRGETPGTSRKRGSLQLLIPFPSPGWGLGGIFHARILPIKGNSLLLKSVKWFGGFCLVSYWSKQLLTSLAHIFQSNLALFFFFFFSK